MLKKFLLFCVCMVLLLVLVAAAGLTYAYHYFARDLPRFDSMADYRPYAASQVYAADGTLVAEFYKERRYPVTLNEVPVFVRQAFLAAEDASFYNHPGIDPISIIRALVKNIQTGHSKQGGSTITQQVVKNLLLTREKSLERKVKEAILAYRIEHKLSKDQILEIYLNQISFGHNAYGIKAAARVYFHKELDQLTLAEAAMLGGLPQAPTRYSPIRNLSAAKRRQKYVLEQMLHAKFLPSKALVDEACSQELKVYPPGQARVQTAPYYSDAVFEMFQQQWPEYNIKTDGLQIYTPLDLEAYTTAGRALRRGLREVDKRRGWRGVLEYLADDREQRFREKYGMRLPATLQPSEVYPALVLAVSPQGPMKVSLGAFTAAVDLRKAAWARKKIDAQDRSTYVKPEALIRPGDVVEVSFSEQDLKKLAAAAPGAPAAGIEAAFDQTPEIQGALIALDPNSGKVVTVIGGYQYVLGRDVFNRAVQAHRQPGSAFKPIVYLTAIDGFKYTPATIVQDIPRTFKVGDQFWTPGNYENDYLGAITLRTALQRSRNLVSADITYRIGVDAVIQNAKKMGIESRIGRNLSISLGSSEVTPLELTRAYGVFAAKGLLFPSVFVTRILDRDGKPLYDYEEEKLLRAHQAIDPNSAFIMAHMMKGVIENGTGYRAKAIGRPAAGKTGTTNDLMDAWFIAYTPDWVCGVWTGFDAKRKIGTGETGGRVSAPIWLEFMSQFLNKKDREAYEQLVLEAKAEAEQLGLEYSPPEPLKPRDFDVPSGVDPYWVNKDTGRMTTQSDPAAILEYFKKDTAPQQAEEQESEAEYWNSAEL